MSTMTREQMVQEIQDRGSVVFDGRIFLSRAELPTQAEIDAISESTISTIDGLPQGLAQAMSGKGWDFGVTPYTAPVITLSAAGAATGLTTPTTYLGYEPSARTTLPWSATKPAVIGRSPHFTWLGCKPVQAGGGAPNTDMAAGLHNSSGLDNGHIKAKFWHDGSRLEILHKGQGNKLMVTVDGVVIILATSATSVIGGITLPGNTGSVYRILIDWEGVVAPRCITVEQTGFFPGVAVDATATIWAAAPDGGMTAIELSDSLGEGTDAYSRGSSLVGVCAGLLGWTNIFNCGSGSTGYITMGSNGRMKAGDRAVPDYNSWRYYKGGATGGTFTISVRRGGSIQTTSALAYNASLATLTAAVEGLSNVGTGNVQVLGNVAGRYFILFRNVLANEVDCTVTIDATSITGGSAGARICERYTGDVAPNIPLDAEGNELPFILIFSLGFNDSATAPAVIAAECRRVWTEAQRRFPTALIFVFGPHSPSATITANLLAADAAIMDEAEITLRKINGYTPAVSQLGWITGTGRVGATTGSGNADLYTSSDAVHMTHAGHRYIGTRRAAEFARILGIRQD